ncbi:hypothetical protein MMC08_001877 [Hypocenomyce scalaris]|nr:hypothetical protein [Hypocenomyce scalaris]
MPTRVTLLETIRPGKPQNDGVSAPLMHDLFQPLQLECSRELKENALRTTADSSTRTLSTIPLLFNLVIRCTPLANTKHRTAEMPWLQSLFICLAQCASAPVSASSMSPPARLSLQVLERMLGIAVASNIQLGTSLLENVMSQFSGIASSELSDVNWELVGLCLKLDPNVFLMPSSTRDSGKTRPPQLGSDFLAPLLAKITAIGLKKPQGAPALYGLVLSDIVLPLVAAFAHARGLDRFVGCWQEQLRLCENSQCTSATDITIWEDEALLHLVARLLEPSLITAQIEKIFYAAYVDLDKGSAIGPNSTGAMASVSSVIIECIVDGCTRETVTAKLTNTAQLVYHLSLLILKEAPYRTTKLRWRLWRIAASLRSHWPGASSPPNVSDAASAAENRALAKASETFLRSTDSGWLPQDRMEALQAFKFVLSFAPVEQRTDLEKGLPQYQIKSAIRWVTKCLKNELEKTDPNRSPRWDGKAATAISQEALLIGCVTQLLISSTALK